MDRKRSSSAVADVRQREKALLVLQIELKAVER
jgi:hypothetical protein